MLYQCISQSLLVFTAFYPINIVPRISPNTFFVMANNETLNIRRKQILTYVSKKCGRNLVLVIFVSHN
jgi:hypothetical protein